jgi:CheY-like chemotaxis protein
MRILVVDDEPAVRRSVRSALTLEGYEVRLAREGAEALDVLASEHVDAVVLDLLMPGVDGLEVCRRLSHQTVLPRRAPCPDASSPAASVGHERGPPLR